MDLKYCAAFHHYNKWNKKGEYHHLRKVKIDDVLSHEFLDMAKDRLPFNRNLYCRHQQGKLQIAPHNRHSIKVMSFMRARFIEFPKCSCIIGKIWLTLIKSLVLFSSYEKRELFFKVTEFQGLSKMQQVNNQLINHNYDFCHLLRLKIYNYGKRKNSWRSFGSVRKS